MVPRLPWHYGIAVLHTVLKGSKHIQMQDLTLDIGVDNWRSYMMSRTCAAAIEQIVKSDSCSSHCEMWRLAILISCRLQLRPPSA